MRAYAIRGKPFKVEIFGKTITVNNHIAWMEYLAKDKFMDPAIRRVVLQLNWQGYITHSSCAGHPSQNPNHRGHLLFYGRLDKAELTSLLESFWLQDISISWEKIALGDGTQIYMTNAEFRPFGGSKTRTRVKRNQIRQEVCKVGGERNE